MDLAHTKIVARDEAVKDLGKEHAFLWTQPPDNTEVHRHEIARSVDEQVALVHVRMEKAIADRVAQKALDHGIAKLDEIEPLRAKRIHISDWRSVNPLGGQHVPAGPLPIDLWHAKVRVIPGVLRHLGKGCGLHAQVEFLLHGLLEHVHCGNRSQPASLCTEALHEAGSKIEAAKISSEPLSHAWAQNLDSKFAAVRASRLVHLGNRCGRDGRAKLCEQDVDGSAEIVPHDLLCRMCREGWKPVLKGLQLKGAARANEIGARRQELAQLDIAGTKR